MSPDPSQTRPKITSIIAAVAANGVIGLRNALPWRLPADLKHFKQTTTGHTLIMGRKTWDSLGGKPLPHRRHIIISQQPGFDPNVPGVQVAASLDHALALAAGEEEAFIAGGAEIYRLALPIADRLYLTRIDVHPEGDVWFPPVDWTRWKLVEQRSGIVDSQNTHIHFFEIYVSSQQ